MIKDFAVIDFETYYDTDYSLSKMQNDAYVLDERFQIIGVGVKKSIISDPEWFTGTHEEVKKYLDDAFDWATTAVCCHHAHFDGFICEQVLSLRPKLWLDTLSMARMHYPWLKRHGLAAVADYLGLGEKGQQVHHYKGYALEDFTTAQLADYGEYCKQDVALTHMIAQLLLENTPPLELAYIDMTVRMFTEPKLVGDVGRLVAYHESEVNRKEQLLEEAGLTRDDLMSNNKLADILRDYGVRPPVKISKRTGKETYAFAKSDKKFTELLEHPNPNIQAIVAARIGVKSTIAETRALRLIEAAKRGPLPVYLHHWGAKTTGRLSGGNKMNWQNIPARGAGSEIRKCLIAPPGYKVVVGDSSNIELRVAMVAAGQMDAVDKIAKGEDLYCDFASKLYGRAITKADKQERLVGKIAMLSLQYGAGFKTFKEMCRVQAQIKLEDDEAERVVNLYRAVHSDVASLWNYCNRIVLQAIANEEVMVPVDRNAWVLTTTNGFSVPGYPGVCYHNLRLGGDGQWTYSTSTGEVKIYGGKIVENLCQHVARQIVLWQTARVHRKYPVALSVHDEIVCVVPEDQAEDCLAYMLESLSIAPKWTGNTLIPLEGEGAIGDSYGDAK